MNTPYHLGPRRKRLSEEESCVPYYQQDQFGFSTEQCCQVIDELSEESKAYFTELAKYLCDNIKGLSVNAAKELIVKYNQWVLSPAARAYQDKYSMKLIRMYQVKK